MRPDGSDIRQRTDGPWDNRVTAGDQGWRVSLADREESLALRLGATGWTVDAGAIPTAVSGGWTDQETLRVDVLFLETPHRMTLTCTLADRTFTARWHTIPLHGGPLRSLHAPSTSP